MMNQAKCTTCGAGLTIKKGDKTCVCGYCQSTNIVENALALGKVEVDVTEDIKKLRANLTTFVQQNSIDEILRVSQKLLDWIPQDFVALYFFGYAKQQQNQPRFLYDFYKEPPVYTQTELEVVVEHIIHKSELRDKGRLVGFFEFYFPQKLREYVKIHEEREKQENNYANIPRDVFVCFSSYNKDVAEKVVEELEADGNTCWISTRNLRPEDAENYWMNIEQAVQNSSIFLVISSEDSMRSKDVQQEIDFARKYHKKMVEFKIDDMPHNTLFKHVFDGIKWVKGTSYQNQSYVGLIQRIFDELDASKPLILTKKSKVIQKRHTCSSLKLKPKYFYFIGLAVLIISLLVIIDFRAPEMELIGDEIIVIRYGQLYEELGANAIDNRDGVIDVIISGEVDTTIVGSYVLTYEAVDSAGNLSKLTRQVDVVDDVPPRLNFIGSSRVIVEAVSGRYIELGINAIDEYEGRVEYEITGGVDSNTIGDYIITYSAKDQFGNSSSIVRLIQVVDTTPPLITLNGSSEIVVNNGESYEELRAIAVDAYDGEVELSINVKSNIGNVGFHTVEYSASDSQGNVATIVRSVLVLGPIQCTDCQGRLNWNYYLVDRSSNLWSGEVNQTDGEVLYTPITQQQFSLLEQTSRLAATGNATVVSNSLSNGLERNIALMRESLISWFREPSQSSDPIRTVFGVTPVDKDFAFEIHGYFVPKHTGTYTFTMQSNDASELAINNKVILGLYRARNFDVIQREIGLNRGSISLTANVPYPIRIRYQNGGGCCSGLVMYWVPPTEKNIVGTTADFDWIQDPEEIYLVNPYGY